MSPMKVFLNRYMGRNRFLVHQSAGEIRAAFIPTIEFALAVLGADVFRPQRALNATVFDAVMTALALRLRQGPIESPHAAREAYSGLLKDPGFVGGIVRATANEGRVKQRRTAAIAAFANVP